MSVLDIVLETFHEEIRVHYRVPLLEVSRIAVYRFLEQVLLVPYSQPDTRRHYRYLYLGITRRHFSHLTLLFVDDSPVD